MGRVGLALVFQSPDLQGQQLRLGDLRDHVRELLLHQLVRSDGPPVELLAQDGISARRLVAIHGRADHAPADAVASLREAGERRAQPLRLRKQRAFRHAAVVEREARRHRRPHRQLPVNLGGSKPRSPTLD